MTRAVVIGAGIGGLSAAIGLRQAGWEVAVYERAPELSLAGAGITLWSNAIRALRALGVSDALLEGARLTRGLIRDSKGALIAASDLEDVEKAAGAPCMALHRAALHRALLACLPEGIVKLGTELTTFEPGGAQVTARFTGGKSATADLLVGADGIHSTVRQQLFPGVKLRYGGYVGWRGVVTGSTGLAVGETGETWGCGQRFGIVPIGAGQVYWFATANQPERTRRSPLERKSFLLKAFRGWHAPVEQLISATPQDRILENDIIDFKPLPRWSKGRVVLLGDSAHAATPNLGQGACQAIESSLALAQALSKGGDLADGLQAYELRRQPRAAWITRQSQRVGRVAQWENPLLCLLRDELLRLAPKGAMTAQIKKVLDL